MRRGGHRVGRAVFPSQQKKFKGRFRRRKNNNKVMKDIRKGGLLNEKKSIK